MLLAMAIAAAVTSNLNAAVAVTNGDIVGNTYNFSILGSQLQPENLNGSSVSYSNFQNVIEGGGTTYLAGISGSTSASFVIGWDFSGSEYTPTSASLSNYFVMIANSSTAIGTLAWSVDNFNWTDFRSVTQDAGQTQGYLGTDVIDLTGLVEAPTAFYMRMTYTANTGTFNYAQNEWGRVDNGANTAFSASFAVVPEPSTYALLGLSLVGMAIGMRFGKRKSSVTA